MRTVAIAAIAAFILALTPSVVGGALVNISVEDDFFDPDVAAFDFAADPNVKWDWNFPDGTNHDHNVVQKRGLFDSGNPKDDGDFELAASAGKYPYYCEVHRDEGMKAKVSILPAAHNITPDSMDLEWAILASTTGNRFDVRYRVNGGDWEIWKKRTKKRGLTFGGPDDKPIAFDLTMNDYEFSVRSQKGKPSKRKRSGYSPPLLVE